MRRRTRATAPDAPPARLLNYDPADWRGVGCHPQCAYWAAVERWSETVPADEDGLPGGPLIFDGPDVPFRPVQVGDLWMDEAHPGERI